MIAGVIFYLARKVFPPIQVMGVAAYDTHVAMTVGFLTGLLLALVQFRIESWFPRIRQLANDHPLLQGPWQTWTVIIIAGALSEELWRALSLQTLQAAGFNLPVVIVLTSLAYAFAQLGGVPGRLLGIWEDVVAAVVVGLALALLFREYGSVLANCAANLTFNSLKMYAARH